MAQKRAFNEGKRHFKKNKKQKTSVANDGSNEEVLLTDIRKLLQETRLSSETIATVPEQFSEVELDITELSSTGDGLASKDGHIFVVPFTAPGDKVLARVYRNDHEHSYSLADYVELLTPSAHRADTTPKCPYFTQCSGCQFQHLPYSYHLTHKRRIIEKAYQNFSGLPASSIPVVGDTIGSPLQYGYRTKLTPHFDGPPGGRRDRRHGKKAEWPEIPPIGFMKKGTRKTMDIEDCPIGTEAVRLGLKKERKRVAENIDQYQRGATLLLRESTERIPRNGENPNGDTTQQPPNDPDAVLEEQGEYIERKTCITSSTATSTEYIDSFRFSNPAGSFFQNNNSILPLLTAYLRSHILGQPPANPTPAPITNLIDAYTGSGFFTLTLSSLFTHSIGIDISIQSIASATHNLLLNNIPPERASFLAADATTLFSSVDRETFPPAQTVIIIDPPRKGCDAEFLRQVLAFGPERVCYVSCNVHTQARDVGVLVRGVVDGRHGEEAAGEGTEQEKVSEERDAGERGVRYTIESLRGFDFFPQTGHVEGVALLQRVRGEERGEGQVREREK